MNHTKKKMIILVVLLFSLLLSGCSLMDYMKDIDFPEERHICKEMVRYVQADNFESAYALVQSSTTEEDFRETWDEMHTALQDVEECSMTVTGYHISMVDGERTTEVTFEIEGNDGTYCKMNVISVDRNETLLSRRITFRDSTYFVKLTSFVPTLDIVLKVLSAIFIAFMIWMIVDCARRPLRRKAFWIVVIMLTVGYSMVIPFQMDFNIDPNSFFVITQEYGLLLSFASAVAKRATETLAIKLVFPIGAVAYFLLRKKLPLKTDDLLIPDSMLSVPIEVPVIEQDEADSSAEEQAESLAPDQAEAPAETDAVLPSEEQAKVSAHSEEPTEQ